MNKGIKPQISKKINYFFKKMDSCRKNISKPDVENLKLLIFSILKGQTPVLNPLLGQVELNTEKKHKEKRLRNYLGKDDLWSHLSEDYLNTISYTAGNVKYCIVDHSDIIKRYGRMEFIKHIYDGSTGMIEYGYKTLNILGIDSTGGELVPLYSELYSTKGPDVRSENTKIMQGVSLTTKYVRDGIYVMDREFDRNILFQEFLRNGTHFITRLTKKRYLIIDDEKIPSKDWRKKVEMKYNHTFNSVMRTGHLQKKTFRIGLKKVELNCPAYKEFDLWLMVMKRVAPGIKRSRGFSYYLAFLPKEHKDEKEIIDVISKGYGYRWKIEEYHRFLKSELNYEAMQFTRYKALKSMTTIMMIATYFIFHGLKSLFWDRIKTTFRKHEYERYWKGRCKFIYYELSRLIKEAIYSMKLYRKTSDNASPPPANLFTIAGLDEYEL